MDWLRVQNVTFPDPFVFVESQTVHRMYTPGEPVKGACSGAPRRFLRPPVLTCGLAGVPTGLSSWRSAAGLRF